MNVLSLALQTGLETGGHLTLRMDDGGMNVTLTGKNKIIAWTQDILWDRYPELRTAFVMLEGKSLRDFMDTIARGWDNSKGWRGQEHLQEFQIGRPTQDERTASA